jgi:hypothetical protein
MFDVDDWVLYYELFNFSSQTIIVETLCNCNLTCSISIGVGLYLDWWNVNKFSSIQALLRKNFLLVVSSDHLHLSQQTL